MCHCDYRYVHRSGNGKTHKEYFKEYLLTFMGLHGRKTSITIKRMNEEFTRIPAALKDFETSHMAKRK